jgi:hypothetical protein
MNLAQLIRLGVTAAIWAIVAVFMVLGGIINLFWTLPAVLSFLFIGLGIAGTALVWNPKTWHQLHEKLFAKLEEDIEYQLSRLEGKDLAEAEQGVREVKERFGIDILLPLGKQKNAELEEARRHLSEAASETDLEESEYIQGQGRAKS